MGGLNKVGFGEAGGFGGEGRGLLVVVVFSIYSRVSTFC